jgi:hypothetical protein
MLDAYSFYYPSHATSQRRDDVPNYIMQHAYQQI